MCDRGCQIPDRLCALQNATCRWPCETQPTSYQHPLHPSTLVRTWVLSSMKSMLVSSKAPNSTSRHRPDRMVESPNNRNFSRLPNRCGIAITFSGNVEPPVLATYCVFGGNGHWAQFQRASKAMKQQAKQTKKALILDVMNKLEIAAERHDLHQVYTQPRWLAPWKPASRSNLRGPDGQILSPQEQVAELQQHSQQKICKAQPLQLTHRLQAFPAIIPLPTYIKN